MDNTELELRALYYKAIEDYRCKEEDKHDEGFMFLSQAAERGMVEACKLLGILYTSGQYDPYPAKDSRKAISLYKQAADQGDEEAMYWLSQCYEMGIGVEKNPEEAALWREMALDHGFVPSEEQTIEPTDKVKASDTAPSVTVTNVEVISVEDQKLEDMDSEEAPSESAAKEDAENTAEGALTDASDQETSGEENEAKDAEDEPEDGYIPEEEDEEDIPFPKAAEKPKQEKTFEEKLQEKEEKEKALQLAEDRMQKLRYVLIAGGIMLGLGLVLALILYAVLSGFLSENGGKVYWIIAFIIMLAMAGLGAFYGFNRAKVKIQKAEEYRKTVFYETFGGSFGALDAATNWNYKIYKTLEKLYKPISYKTPTVITKKGVGLMVSGWTFTNKRGSVRPDFVILTPKSMYVVDSIGIKGRVMGDLLGYDWTLYKDGGKDGGQTMEKVENGIERLKSEMITVKSCMQLLSPLPLERIPVVGVLAVAPETDIKGLRVAGAGSNITVDQGSPDKLRMTMTMRDRALKEHEIEMEDLAKVLDEIGKTQLDEMNA